MLLLVLDVPVQMLILDRLQPRQPSQPRLRQQPRHLPQAPVRQDKDNNA